MLHDYKNKYEDLIKELNFIELNSIKKDRKNGRFVARGVVNRRDVLLKVLPNTNQLRVSSLKKEFMIDRLLNKHNKDLKQPMVAKANVLKMGSNKTFTWVIRRYYAGSSLSDYSPNKNPLLGYDILKNKFIFKRNNIISQIVENEQSLAKMTKDFRSLGIKKENIKRRYYEEISSEDVDKLGGLLSSDFSKTVDFYSKNKKDYFSSNNIVACMGDLAPANILIKNDGQVLFSDFEWFCFDNYMIDFAFLWLFLKRYRNWQKKLIQLSVKNDDDRQNFRISVIREVYWWYSKALLEYEGTDRQERIKYYKKHIWTRHLNAAGESYEALIKVK